MQKGSETRSSLLWEVERILNELKETDSLPQILLMENVTAIHNEKNKPDFAKWLEFLEKLGYSTYVQDLNSWDYGVAQSRDRCFAVSILGEYNYKFPEPIDLKYCIEDYYEDLDEEQALQLVVKSPKALELLHRLGDEGKLEKQEHPETVEKTMDGMKTLPKDILMRKVINIGFFDSGTGKHQSNTVYRGGCIPTITTITGGGTQQIKVMRRYRNDSARKGIRKGVIRYGS